MGWGWGHMSEMKNRTDALRKRRKVGKLFQSNKKYSNIDSTASNSKYSKEKYTHFHDYRKNEKRQLKKVTIFIMFILALLEGFA